MTAGNGQSCKRCGTSEWNIWGSCKECARRKAAQWKDENPERKKENDKNWQQNNKDKVNARNKKWKENNLEKFLGILRIASRNWRKNNPDKQREASRKWKQEHTDQNSIIENKRRSRKHENGGTYTIQEWQTLCNKYGNKCLSCKRTDVKLTQDHVIPISLGGTNTIDNIQPLCKSKQFLLHLGNNF